MTETTHRVMICVEAEISAEVAEDLRGERGVTVLVAAVMWLAHNETGLDVTGGALHIDDEEITSEHRELR